MFKVGPIGEGICLDGRWDEKGHTMISAIFISFNDYRIKSIQFKYLHKGAHVVSKNHGSSVGDHFEIVRLDNDEYLTGLSGVDYNSSITDLTFHTNKRKHGPFCRRSYASGMKVIDVGIRDRSEFGGLFGSFCQYGGYLNSIGMYVSPIASNGTAPEFCPAPTTTITTHNRTLDCQTPKVVDGFPVKHIRRCKPKLKDRIRSKLEKAIWFLLDLFD
ncbi:unnamed protein product [Thlaspi arvense]|uniref:Jacalin-type lectin domain-containing protein n=1 Tax=Thlaspi arvense TaxID=13288 RepID=A0AAU9S8Z3_THLAR|nr:unnamed protein product [Thlaspi arvense]